jgi:hypothetical protein
VATHDVYPIIRLTKPFAHYKKPPSSFHTEVIINQQRRMRSNVKYNNELSEVSGCSNKYLRDFL